MGTDTKGGQEDGSGGSKGGGADSKDTPGTSPGSRQSGRADNAQRQGKGDADGKRARYDDTVDGKQARYDSGRNRGGG